MGSQRARSSADSVCFFAAHHSGLQPLLNSRASASSGVSSSRPRGQGDALASPSAALGRPRPPREKRGAEAHAAPLELRAGGPIPSRPRRRVSVHRGRYRLRRMREIRDQRLLSSQNAQITSSVSAFRVSAGALLRGGSPPAHSAGGVLTDCGAMMTHC